MAYLSSICGKTSRLYVPFPLVDKGHSNNLVNRHVEMSGGGVVQVPIPNSIYFYNQLMAGVIFLIS